MAKRVLVPIADDSEEIETTCITDTLVRFGAEVVVASVKPGGELVCKMSRGVKVRSQNLSCCYITNIAFAIRNLTNIYTD